MKINKFLCIILIFYFTLAGCHIRKDVAASHFSNTEINRETVDSSYSQTDKRREDFNQKIESEMWRMFEEYERIKLSKPDSCGNQYPEEITKVKRTIDREKQAQANLNTIVDICARSGANHFENETVKNIQKSELQQKVSIKTHTPIWVWLLLIGGIVAGVVFLSVKFGWVTKLIKIFK